MYKKGCAIPSMEVADVNFFWQLLEDSSSDDWRRDCVFVCFLIVLLFCVFRYC